MRSITAFGRHKIIAGMVSTLETGPVGRSGRRPAVSAKRKYRPAGEGSD